MKIQTIWKTIEIGGNSKQDLIKEIESKGMKVSDWAKEILRKAKFEHLIKQNIDLVKMSVAELGFENGATLKEIYSKAKEIGLELCPNEVGAELRLQYADQPEYEWFRIAMEAITDSDGNRTLFNVAQDGDALWLYGNYGDDDYFCRASNIFVFCLRKSTSDSDTQSSLESLPFDLRAKAENLAIDFCEKWVDGKARAVIELRDKILEIMK